MLITLTRRMNIAEYARHLDLDRSTVDRWVKNGVDGVKLATVRMGGCRYVTPESHAAFVRALNPPPPPEKRGRGRPRKHDWFAGMK